MHVGFLQTLCTWYLRATGGTPSTVTQDSSSISVIVEKRGFDQRANILPRDLLKRADSTESEITVAGIRRMAYQSKIEPTNVFMTSYCMFMFIGVLLSLGLVTLKVGYVFLGKSKKLPSRLQFTTAIIRNSGQGIILLLLTIATHSASVFCFWEFTRFDSAGELVLAISWWAGLTFSLAWITAAIIFHVQRTQKVGMNSIYALYLDSTRSEKLSFLHAHFSSETYYFFAVVHLYRQAKGIITAVSQSAPIPQAILFVVIDAIMMGLIIWLHPYLNKSMNRHGIAMAIIGFLNSVCALIFSDIFHGPKMMASIVGVLFCVYNATYMLVQVIYIIIVFCYAIGMKYPESRYRRISGNRGSFIDSHAPVSNELADLSVIARGDSTLLAPSSSSNLTLYH